MHKRSILKAPAALLVAIFKDPPPWLSAAVVLLLLLYAALSPAALAWAQDLSPVVDVTENIAKALTGTFATAVGTIGLVGCGILAMSGRMPWGAAISVVLGIILIFGAGTIVGEIAGEAGGTAGVAP